MIQGRSKLNVLFVLAFFLTAIVGLLVLVVQTFEAPPSSGFTAKGSESCLSCHFSEKMLTIQAGPHGNADDFTTPDGKLGCESCHGPGSFHVSRGHGGKGLPPLISFSVNPDPTELMGQVSACLRCHTFTSATHPLVRRREIDTGAQSCGECHQIHSASEDEDTWDW